MPLFSLFHPCNPTDILQTSIYLLPKSQPTSRFYQRHPHLSPQLVIPNFHKFWRIPWVTTVFQTFTMFALPWNAAWMNQLECNIRKFANILEKVVSMNVYCVPKSKRKAFNQYSGSVKQTWMSAPLSNRVLTASSAPCLAAFKGCEKFFSFNFVKLDPVQSCVSMTVFFFDVQSLIEISLMSDTYSI